MIRYFFVVAICGLILSAHAQLTQTGGGLGTVRTIFVDQVNGSDLNLGTSAAVPVSTLSKTKTLALVIGNGVRIALARGSYWREALDLSTLANVSVGSYGAGSLPIIDGADVVSAWTPASGQIHTYQVSVNQNGVGTDRLTIYENGVLLTREDSIANVEANSASFYGPRADAGNPAIVYVHPAGDTDPNADGNMYEVSTRSVGIQLGGGGSISGVQTMRVLDNNGSSDLVNVPKSQISSVLTVWGTKHGAGIGSGEILDSIAYGADSITSYEPSNTSFVAFLGDAAGSSYDFERVGAIQPDSASWNAGAFATAHDSAGHAFSSGKLKQCWGHGNIFFSHPDGTVSWQDATMTGCFDDRTLTLGFGYGIVKYAMARDSHSLGTANGIQTVDLQDSSAYIEDRFTQGNFNEVFRLAGPADVIWSHVAISVAPVKDAGAVFGNSSASSGSVHVDHSIFFGDSQHLQITSGVSYSGDYNVFYALSQNLTNDFNSYYGGAQYTSIHGWQVATSQDVHSVVLKEADQTIGNANAFWLAYAQASVGTDASTVGPAVGDFHINPNARVYGGDGTAYIGTFTDGVIIAQAGAQNHWDWNARGPVGGPPLAWPNIPTTLSAAQQYVGNPVAWRF